MLKLLVKCFAVLSITLMYANNLFAQVDNSSGVENKKGLPQFDYHTFPSQVLWLFIVFIILYIVVALFIIPRISKIKSKRTHYIDENIFYYENNHTEINKIIKTTEERLKQAYKNYDSYLADVHHDLFLTEKRLLNDVKKHNENLKASVYTEIEQNNQLFYNNLDKHLNDTVKLVLDKVNIKTTDENISSTVKQHLENLNKLSK